jgi:tRNA G18 (ribose-2'-O)-methylase SpoU
VALFPPLDQDPEEVRRLLAPLRNDLSVAIYNHGNPYSVGGIIRVAHSFLVREILIIGSKPFYEKASMGMHRYETIRVFEGEEPFVQCLADRPLWAVEKDSATISLFAVEQYPRDVVLLFGSERAGLPASLLGRAQQVVGIPMYGVNHSYPVAISAGMVLCDWARRRYKPGTVVAG